MAHTPASAGGAGQRTTGNTAARYKAAYSSRRKWLLGGRLRAQATDLIAGGSASTPQTVDAEEARPRGRRVLPRRPGPWCGPTASPGPRTTRKATRSCPCPARPAVLRYIATPRPVRGRLDATSRLDHRNRITSSVKAARLEDMHFPCVRETYRGPPPHRRGARPSTLRPAAARRPIKPSSACRARTRPVVYERSSAAYFTKDDENINSQPFMHWATASASAWRPEKAHGRERRGEGHYPTSPPDHG